MLRRASYDGKELTDTEQQAWNELIADATTPKSYRHPDSGEDLASEIRKAVWAQRSTSHTNPRNRDGGVQAPNTYSTGSGPAVLLNTPRDPTLDLDHHGTTNLYSDLAQYTGAQMGLGHGLSPDSYNYGHIAHSNPNASNSSQSAAVLNFPKAYQSQRPDRHRTASAPSPRSQATSHTHNSAFHTAETAAPAGATASMPFGDPSHLRIEQFDNLRDLIAAKRDMRLANENASNHTAEEEKSQSSTEPRSTKQKGYTRNDSKYRIKKASKPAIPRRPARMSQEAGSLRQQINADDGNNNLGSFYDKMTAPSRMGVNHAMVEFHPGVNDSTPEQQPPTVWANANLGYSSQTSFDDQNTVQESWHAGVPATQTSPDSTEMYSDAEGAARKERVAELFRMMREP
ncbi:hypothetical protein DL98DRAFT_529817 [Cadophora sp. DSE1049]|nr:hypothetical protein DL98DRAFT_529817 [Cadophora sp. DSE1049]